MRPTVFLDRDDTLIDTSGATAQSARQGDLARPDLVRLLPGVLQALTALDRAGFTLVGYSNQGAVARGNATVADVHAVNARLFELLAFPTSKLLDIPARPFVSRPAHPSLLQCLYFCPFHPEGTVTEFARDDAWRKPSPGMILAAAADLDLDLGRSWGIGDSPRDVEAAQRAGLPPRRTILIGPGRSPPDLAGASRIILEHADPNA